jgi:hypothetical protein
MSMMTVDVEDRTIPVYAGRLNTGQIPFSDDFKEYAFTIYTDVASLNILALRDILIERHGIDVPTTTLYRWKRTGNWNERSRTLYQTLRPGLINSTLDNMVMSAYEGSKRIRNMIDGKETADSTLANIAFKAIDRVGLMPHSAVAEHIRLRMSDTSSSIDTTMTDEELRQLESSYQPDSPILPDADIPEVQVRLVSNQRNR